MAAGGEVSVAAAVRAMAGLGDGLLRSNKPTAAADTYREAWTLASPAVMRQNHGKEGEAGEEGEEGTKQKEHETCLNGNTCK